MSPSLCDPGRCDCNTGEEMEGLLQRRLSVIDSAPFLMTILSETGSTILRCLGFRILERGGGWCQVLIHVQFSLPCFPSVENSAQHCTV